MTQGEAAAREIVLQARDLLDRSLTQIVRESHTEEGWKLGQDISSWLYRSTVGDVEATIGTGRD